MDPSLLYFTLAAVLVSFVCTTYTTLRTLVPLLPLHPLHRHRRSPSAPISRDRSDALDHDNNTNNKPQLKSAQRFTVYLALTDLFATSVLLWEVACAVSSDGSNLGASKLSDTRVYLATTARPTLLLIVAVLSYTNVIRGRSISLGWADSIVWGPALVLYVVGGGLASLATVNSSKPWIGLLVWLSVVTLVVTFCFVRLLVAILRVRSLARREQTESSWPLDQEKSTHSISEHDLPYHQRYSLTFLPNFSGLSTNFVPNIGRSSRGPSHDLERRTFDNHSVFTVKPLRHSQDDVLDDIDARAEFRSPTPGSTRHLLDRSTAPTRASSLNVRASTTRDDAEEILDTASRHSIGESIASRASTYFAAAGGFVANSSVRQAIIREAWKGQDVPGTGHSPKIELSDREARGAIVRLGGHLVSSILGFAFVSPLVCVRMVNPSSSAPVVASFLLVVGVCEPSIVLAYQCWMSEGFWFRRTVPPVLASSSSANGFEGIEVVEEEEDDRHRSTSRASAWKDSLPGIRPDGEDCDTVQRGRLGRALSVLSTHPKLQLLNHTEEDTVVPSGATSGFVKSGSSTGAHVRLRSLKLSKHTIASVGDILPRRSRTGSAASRQTFGGFEQHARGASAPVNDFDRAIALQLLASRPKTPNSAIVRDRRAASLSCSTPLNDGRRNPAPSPVPSPCDFELDCSTREVSVPPPPPPSSFSPSNSVPTSSAEKKQQRISIDHLSAAVLPHLVPSLRLGHDLHVDSSSDPLPRPPRLVETLSSTGRRSRNVRSLSLPLAKKSPAIFVNDGATADTEVWISVEEGVKVCTHTEEEEEMGPRPEKSVASVLDSTDLDHERSGSTATKLDFSFDWEAVDDSYLLGPDETIFCADDASFGELQHVQEDEGEGRRQRRPRSTLDFSPVLPLSFSRRDLSSRPRPTSSLEGSIVHKGSDVSIEDEDVHTSTFHCATVRPVVRSEEASGSINSTRTFGELDLSCVTSEGFRNLLTSAGHSWHVPASPGVNDRGSSAERRRSFLRRPLPTPPLQPGLRPLSLLGQHDSKHSPISASLNIETELGKTNSSRATRKAETSSSPSSRPTFPLSPVHKTLDEEEELEHEEDDKSCGTRARKAHRLLEPIKAQPLSALATTTAPRLPPAHVTLRTKHRAGSRHHRNASLKSVKDENFELGRGGGGELDGVGKSHREGRPDRAVRPLAELQTRGMR